MTDQFASEPTDFTSLYSNAPKDQALDPSEELFTQLTESLKPDQLSGIAQGGEAPKTPAAKVASSTKMAGADSAATLARVKPLGITSVEQLRGKSDAELRTLSQSAITYELRQASLARFFGKNPDGSWNYMVGPDGQPTGLDAAGRVIPPQPPASAAAPAAAPAVSSKPAAPTRSQPAAATPAVPPPPPPPPPPPAPVVSQARTGKRATTVRKPPPAPVVKQPVVQTGQRATPI